MPIEHVIVKEQASWDTWVDPDIAMPMDSFSLDPGVSRVERRPTGQGRGLAYSWLGSKLITGSFAMAAWMENLGYFFKMAGLHDIASNQIDTSTAYEHGFFPKDDTTPPGLSVQLKRDADDADNILGLLIGTLTLNCQAGEPLAINGDYIALDEAPTGGTWDYDGAAAPSVVATPSYFANTILPFRFEHGELLYGATLTYDDTANKFTKTGGSSALIEMIEVSLENNWDPRVFLNSRLAANVVGQDRAISGRFDLDQSTVDETFRNFYRAGTKGTLWLEFASGVEIDAGNDYSLIIVVPNVDFTGGALPDISGSNERRIQSVEYMGLLDENGVDLNVQLIDTVTTYQ